MLDGTSVATLRNDPAPNPNDPPGGIDVVGPDGQIIFMSAGAELIQTLGNDNDVRSRIINGLTGMSYADDPTAWNDPSWNGTDPIALLKLAGVAGDFDNDGDVDGADFLVWQRGLGTSFTASDLDDWKTNYGTGASSALASATNVPEPTSVLLLFLACSVCGIFRQARKI